MQNACVDGSYTCDIGIKNQLISALDLGLVATEDTEIIDCEGAGVTPGGVYGHVHFAQDRSLRARAAGYVSVDTSKT